jgi:hypothetical protein
MTSMIDKPRSKKAKTHERFSGTQDHGEAGQRAGRRKKTPDHGYWEQRWDRRGAVNTDKTYLNEVIRDGLVDDKTSAELEDEAERILADTELGDEVDDIYTSEASPTGDYEHGYYDPNDGSYFESGYSYSERLKHLQVTLEGLNYQLSLLPRNIENVPGYEPVDEQRLALEGSIQETIYEINGLLGQFDYPEATYGVKNKKEVRDRTARTATLDEFSDDDFGDDDREQPVHIHNVR